jgi:hypothetical protein
LFKQAPQHVYLIVKEKAQKEVEEKAQKGIK